jgi:hypothetical protein
MGTTNNRVTYGLCILAASAIFLAWITHSGRKPEARKDAPIPWKGEAPSQASALSPKVASSTEASGSSNPAGAEAGQSSVQSYARPSSPSPRPPDDASSASSSLPPSFTTPSLDQESSAADSDQSSAQPQETAAQRVARHLRRR